MLTGYILGHQRRITFKSNQDPSYYVELHMSYTSVPPHSVVSVSAALSHAGWLDHGALVAATGMAPRTVRYALGKLKEAGVLQEKLNFRDMRKIIYSLKVPSTQ